MTKLAIAAMLIALTAATAQAMIWDHFRRSANIEDRRGGEAHRYPIADAAKVDTSLFDPAMMLFQQDHWPAMPAALKLANAPAGINGR